MQTFPCGHKVVCRKCLIKTIQVAVSQRCLPLRCVICRNRILRLQHTSASATATSLAQPLQHQQRQHQVGLQEKSAIGHMLSSPSSSSSPPSSYYSSGSPIAPGCATAGSLTLTPIVIRSFTSSNQDSHSLLNGMVSLGNGQVYSGGYPPTSPRSPSTLSNTSGSSSKRPVGNFTDQPEISREYSSMQDMAIADDMWKRVSPPPPATDMEAFVYSHNDALNLHIAKPTPHYSSTSKSADQDCCQHDNSIQTQNIPKSSLSSSSRKCRSSIMGKREASNKNSGGTSNASSGGRQVGKSNGKAIFSTKSPSVSTSSAAAFIPGQAVKIHPETMAQPNGFMTSPQSAPPVGSLATSIPSSSPTRISKSNISASTFIAKFLPKSSRRRYSCLRHE
ncbi:transcriptional regulator ATRX homolog [Elysia marginata]|uniref:Transcriptional regulator ATRX homolog n=1 Tax=Elysia marginata TaxID=1093978 RepID=A0AAV4J1D8_9GAST|nr:transcriptional regulator ATRX homolog [Elysia marginata]